ncbi:hypothetical protein [Mariniluteicoccus flavus]
MKDSPAYAVIDADQRGSRRGADRVGAALTALAAIGGLTLPFERTAGDEVQALAHDPEAIVSAVTALTRLDLDLPPGTAPGWRIGIGIGPVDDLAGINSTREARGPAYLAAREAVERAGSAPTRLALDGVGSDLAHAESALVVLRALLERRTAKGWEVVDAMAGSGDQKQSEVAATLGRSESAVSQRLDRALWREVRHAEALARHHLGLAMGEGSGG